MAAINGAAARLKDTGRTRPVISASTIMAPSRWRAVSPLGLRRHGPNGSKPVTSTFIKTSHCKTVYPIDCTVFWAVWIRSQGEDKPYTSPQIEFPPYGLPSPANSRVGIVGAMACPCPAQALDCLHQPMHA